MITVRIVFYDKKALLMREDIKIEIPYTLVIAAAEKNDDENELSIATAKGQQIDYINCRPFAVSEEMMAYIVENHPELKEKFKKYEYDFIGRHGLGPEYD